jgi:hypothetical protein
VRTVGTVKQRSFDPDEHFVRLCSRQKQIRDENDLVVGVTWEAFALRKAINENYVSGACKEVFQTKENNGLEAAFDSILGGFSPEAQKKRSSYIAVVIKCKDVLDAGKTRERTLRVRLEPNVKNAGYAALRRLPPDNTDTELLQLLASISSQYLYLPA